MLPLFIKLRLLFVSQYAALSLMAELGAELGVVLVVASQSDGPLYGAVG